MKISRAAFIYDCYVTYLGRLPDSEGFSTFYTSELSEAQLLEIFLDGPERKAIQDTRAHVERQVSEFGKTQNVLIFGAFGNGNLGDYTISEKVDNFVAELDIGFFYYSCIDVFCYKVRKGVKLENHGSLSISPLNPIVLSVFDGLLIGAGGILAHPHWPIWSQEWPYLLPIPHALFAVGVSDPVPLQYRNLVRLAKSASARDQRGVAALRTLSPGAFLCPDPILALLSVPDCPREGAGRAYILRGPVRAEHLQIQKQLSAADTVIGMEIAVDWPLIELFPGISFATSMEQLLNLVQGTEAVVSERYHGAVAGLLSKKRTHGLTRDDHNASKIEELFLVLGVSDFCTDSLPLADGPFPYERVATKLSALRASFPSSFGRLLQELFEGNDKAPNPATLPE
jgi:hypothetical protein